MPETIIDTEFATLWYYPDKKIVAHKLHKFFTGQSFKDFFNKGTDVLQQNGAYKWLSDDRGFSALHPNDREWAFADWSPRTVKAGWKYWAIIMPESILGQLSTRRLIEAYAAAGVEVQVFATMDEAIAWLDSK